MSFEFDQRLLSAAGVVDYAARDRRSDAGVGVASRELLVELRFVDVEVAITAAVPTGPLLFQGSDPVLAGMLPGHPCVSDNNIVRQRLDGEIYRVLITCIAADATGPELAVVVGASESRLASHSRHLILVLSICFLVGFGLTTVGGHWMSGKALSPIRKMTTSVQRIGAEQLDQRLPVIQGDGEIAELSLMVNQLFDRLSALLGRERQFLANAAHALRTPVAVLQAEVTEAMQRATEEPDTGRALHEIAESVDHLKRTVEYLLSLARLDSGTDIAPLERLYLDDIVSGTIARLTRVSEARGVNIVWRRLEETSVRANAQLTDQVTQILFENAAQYCGRGGTVTIDVHQGNDGFGILTVEDDGPGLQPQDLETLFTPFSRGTAAAASGVRGTGLGLAVARWLVDLCGGSIEAESVTPRGARFRVKFVSV